MGKDIKLPDNLPEEEIKKLEKALKEAAHSGCVYTRKERIINSVKNIFR